MLDREFGTYRVLRQLGRGGMADVYLASDTQRGHDVALKVVEVTSDRDSQEIYEAEQRGARLQQQFGCVDSRVPCVFDFGLIQSRFYIAMEYVDGEDISALIQRGPLPAEQAAWIAAELCGFLQRSLDFDAELEGRHVRGIIHGDLKPKNVRLNTAGALKVLDFGIAKGLALSRKLTRNDFGSLTYLSPERLDSGDVDAQSDLWSVGVLLYEMLAGVAPFDAPNAQKLEALIRSRQAPPPLPSTCPPPLARIVLKMLAGHEGRRYRCAADVRADLDAWHEGRSTIADGEWLAIDAAAFEETRRTTNGESVATIPVVVPPLPPAPVDEATRRTTTPVDDAPPPLPAPDAASVPTPEPDTEATRRTAAPPAPPAPPVAPAFSGATTGAQGRGPAALVSSARPPARWKVAGTSRLRIAATVIALIVAILAVGNEAMVSSDAKQLRVNLATGQGPALQDLWSEYQRLSSRSWLRVGLSGLKGPLKDRLQSQADRVVSDYRQDAPTVRENQWRDAASWYTDLLNLDPGDRGATARLRYCEGQLLRIDGEARKRKKQASAPALHDAVAKFEEAARLDSHWPDPYLGLARTYIYGLDDLDKGIAAFNEAERRGYRTGNRELVQMADGYRLRGDRMRREAQTMKGLEQERECLEKAAQDYRQALEVYQKAIGFGEVSTTVRQLQAKLDELQRQIAKLPSSPPSTATEPGDGVGPA